MAQDVNMFLATSELTVLLIVYSILIIIFIVALTRKKGDNP
jgi:hypothetical protein